MSADRDDLVEGLAVDAWLELSPESAKPAAIVMLKDPGVPPKAAAYRLSGAGPGGEDVVAKRFRRRKARVERAVYEHVLPSTGLLAPTYYGMVEEKDGQFAWAFLEDVHGEAFSSERDDHRALADEWLARLHTSASELSRPSDLPEKSPADHREDVRTARERIADIFDDQALEPAVEDALTNALDSLKLVRDRWAEVMELCDGFPETVMNGDVAEKNFAVDETGALVALEWVSAGWGVPATDLARVDAQRYHDAASDAWPHVSVQAVERAAIAGRFFWHLSAMRAATRDLPAEPRLLKLERSRQRLERVMREIGWA